jgi:hypothetical protein
MAESSEDCSRLRYAAQVMSTVAQATADHDRVDCAAQKCSCRSIRFFGYSGAGQPCRPRPRPHTDHSFGLSTGSHAGDRVAAPIGGYACTPTPMNDHGP